MTDAEISRTLALAIGWKKSDIVDYPGQDYVGIRTKILAPCVRLFSYKFPTVIWPIAERFNCFPIRVEAGWIAWSGVRYYAANIATDAAAKAVALAVINRYKRRKTA